MVIKTRRSDSKGKVNWGGVESKYSFLWFIGSGVSAETLSSAAGVV